MAGDSGDAQTAAFLIALRAKGETAEELAGLAATVRSHAEPVTPPAAARSSTPAAPAAGGRPSTSPPPRPSWSPGPAWRWPSTATARRPPRAAAPTCSRRSGRASTWTPTPSRAAWRRPASASCSRPRTTSRSATSCRCAAPSASGRSSTCSGPLTNPAGAPRQLIGVADPAYLERMGRALSLLGCERALLVHGRDGMDEVSTGAITDVVAVQGTAVRASIIDPDRARLSARPRTARSPAATPPTTRPCCAPCWRASPGPRATWWSSTPPRRSGWPGRADTLEDAIPLAVASIDDGPRPGAPRGLRRGDAPARTKLGLRASDAHIPRDRRRAHPVGTRRAQAHPPRLGARAAPGARPSRPPLLGGPDRRGHLPDRRDEALEPVQGPDPARRERVGRGARVPAGRRAGRLGAHRGRVLRRAASTTWSRRAPPATCRCCARTSSWTSTSCSRRARPAPTRCC